MYVICCFYDMNVCVWGGISVPRCQPAFRVQWFCAVAREAAVAEQSFLPLERWFAAECGCSLPFGSWSVASWVSFILHFLLDANEFIRETLLYISSLHGKHWFKGIFLTTQDLHFLLVVVQLVRDVLDLLLSRLIDTSSVCSLPLREAGLEPKLFPVWSINKLINTLLIIHSGGDAEYL